MIIPVGYVAYEYPKYKRREVNKYVRKYSDIENCISYDVMKYMMENAHLYPTLEMADNALSRYIAQKGKCAVTHNACQYQIWYVCISNHVRESETTLTGI